MSLTERLRWLLTPDQSRWKPMLVGLAAFAALAQVVVFYRPPDLVAAVVTGLAVAAWFAGACAMVGYVRWFFRSELSQARQENAAAQGEKDKGA